MPQAWGLIGKHRCCVACARAMDAQPIGGGEKSRAEPTAAGEAAAAVEGAPASASSPSRKGRTGSLPAAMQGVPPQSPAGKKGALAPLSPQKPADAAPQAPSPRGSSSEYEPEPAPDAATALVDGSTPALAIAGSPAKVEDVLASSFTAGAASDPKRKVGLAKFKQIATTVKIANKFAAVPAEVAARQEAAQAAANASKGEVVAFLEKEAAWLTAKVDVAKVVVDSKSGLGIDRLKDLFDPGIVDLALLTEEPLSLSRGEARKLLALLVAHADAQTEAEAEARQVNLEAST